MLFGQIMVLLFLHYFLLESTQAQESIQSVKLQWKGLFSKSALRQLNINNVMPKRMECKADSFSVTRGHKNERLKPRLLILQLLSRIILSRLSQRRNKYGSGELTGKAGTPGGNFFFRRNLMFSLVYEECNYH